MKLKYYLRGLGTGILFATIVLFIAYSYRNTDAKIKERAAELGMVMAESGTVANTIDESGSKKEEQSGETTAEETTREEESSSETTSGETTTPEDKPTETTTPEATTPEETTKEEETKKYTGPEISCTVNVYNRTVSMDVAKQLKKAGVIDDADDFNDFLVDNGYAVNIQNGKHTLKKGMSYKEMAEILTSGK